jgi:hypothetical protein
LAPQRHRVWILSISPRTFPLESEYSSKSKEEFGMRLTRLLFVPLLMGGLSVGCGDDDPPAGPNVSQFAGTWNATAITYTSLGTPTRTLNVFTAANARLNMVIASDGTFSGTFNLPQLSPQPIPMTGRITLQGTNMGAIDFTWPAAVEASPTGPPITDFTATYTLSGNQLTFTRPTTVFQFPGQAAAENSSLVIAMTRT